MRSRAHFSGLRGTAASARRRGGEGIARARKVTSKAIEAAAEAAMAAADPQSDMRGSADYKRVLVRSLVKRAIGVALRRCRGEQVEVSHEYIGRS